VNRRSELDPRLEQALRDLGPRLALPAEPDLAARVGAAIRSGARRPALRPRPARALAFVTSVLVLVASGALALSPAARDAVADFLGIGGVRIEVGRPGPTPDVSPGDNLALGVETTLDEAREHVSFPILVPTARVGAPDRVYVSDFPSGGRVSLVYEPRPGSLPEANETGLGLLITEFEGTLGGDVMKKLSVQRLVRPTDVNGSPAFWLRGTHTVFYTDADGQRRSETLRLSANALIWTSGATTLRIESALGLADTLAIAESMR
jgi:hypothetical protein